MRIQTLKVTLLTPGKNVLCHHQKKGHNIWSDCLCSEDKKVKAVVADLETVTPPRIARKVGPLPNMTNAFVSTQDTLRRCPVTASPVVKPQHKGSAAQSFVRVSNHKEVVTQKKEDSDVALGIRGGDITVDTPRKKKFNKVKKAEQG